MILMPGQDDWRAARAAKDGSFLATAHHLPGDKRKCFDWLKKFMLAGCPQKMWRKGAYKWLYLHLFGHIAHYDMYGFWAVWFDKERDAHRWVDNIATRACYGDPEFTWSDVEVAIKNWLNDGHLELVHHAIRQRFQADKRKARQEKVVQIELWGGL